VSTRYEYYNTGDDSPVGIYDAYWSAQTFTPSTAHKITSVKLLLYRLGSPGTITVGIRATDGSGHPTGADLCSGITDGNTLPTGSPYEWREISLGAGYNLAAGTKYAIVVRAPSGNSTNKVNWRFDSTSPTYAGGNYQASYDSGSSWTTDNTFDFMFEDWGEAPVTAKTSSDTGSGADACVSLGTGEIKTSSDAGSGVEGTPLPGATLTAGETGSSIEAIVARLLVNFDVGCGVEASGVESGVLENLFSGELGEGLDLLVAKIERPDKGGGMKLWT
jgi:hypothetical protein